MPTYVHTVAHSGGETLTDQLANTVVGSVGPSGRVQAGFASAKGEDTFELRLEDGTIIVPAGCHANVLAAADLMSIGSNEFVHDVRALPVGEKMLLTIVAAGASETMSAIRT